MRIAFGQAVITVRRRRDDLWEIPIPLLVRADDYVEVRLIGLQEVACLRLKKLD